jgi:hypothetical protein
MASSSLAGGLMTQPVQFVTPVDDALDFDANGTKLTASQDYFHKIYDIQMGEKGNLDVRDREQNDIIIAQEKEEKDKDFNDMLVDQAVAEMKKMLSIGGYEFSEAALDDVVDGILEDPDAFAKKHNLSAEEMDQVMILATLLENAPDSDAKEKILKDWQKDNPDVVRAVVSDANESTLKKELHSNIEVNAQKNVDALNDANTVNEKKAVVEADVWNVSTEHAVAEHAGVIAEVKDERSESHEADKNYWLSESSDVSTGSFAGLRGNDVTQSTSISDSFSNATSPSETSGVTVASNDMKNAFGLG